VACGVVGLESWLPCPLTSIQSSPVRVRGTTCQLDFLVYIWSPAMVFTRKARIRSTSCARHTGCNVADGRRRSARFRVYVVGFVGPAPGTTSSSPAGIPPGRLRFVDRRRSKRPDAHQPPPPPQRTARARGPVPYSLTTADVHERPAPQRGETPAARVRDVRQAHVANPYTPRDDVRSHAQSRPLTSRRDPVEQRAPGRQAVRPAPLPRFPIRPPPAPALAQSRACGRPCPRPGRRTTTPRCRPRRGATNSDPPAPRPFSPRPIARAR